MGECVLIKCDDNEEAKLEVTDQWKAKVHEVRALDSEHVYLRVSWLNRPEDLPNGRQPHHGKYELIPSNEMDIIDAMTVNGRLDVVFMDELGEDGPSPTSDQFFWRQTVDYVTQKFSVSFLIFGCAVAVLIWTIRNFLASVVTRNLRTRTSWYCNVPTPTAPDGCTSDV